MYAIETELGRFEADTEREAKRQLSKAKREAAKHQAKVNADREIARTRAKATAFDLINRRIADAECPCGWRYYQHGELYAAKATIHKPRIGSMVFSDVRVETEHGFAHIKDWYTEYVGSVMNGSGWDVLIFTKDGNEIQAWSVGVCDDQHAMVQVNGLTMEYFRWKKAQ